MTKVGEKGTMRVSLVDLRPDYICNSRSVLILLYEDKREVNQRWTRLNTVYNGGISKKLIVKVVSFCQDITMSHWGIGEVKEWWVRMGVQIRNVYCKGQNLQKETGYHRINIIWEKSKGSPVDTRETLRLSYEDVLNDRQIFVQWKIPLVEKSR